MIEGVQKSQREEAKEEEASAPAEAPVASEMDCHLRCIVDSNSCRRNGVL